MSAVSQEAPLKVNMTRKTTLFTFFTTITMLLVSCGQSAVPQDYEIDKSITNVKGGAYYEIFVRTFADSDDDGIGDLLGLKDKIDYLEDLGVGGIWLMPIHPSPSYHGYDVEDYQAINKDYGTLADFSAVIEKAHEADIDVIIDLVINHTSSTHPWFKEGLANFKTGNFDPNDNANKANWYDFYWDGANVKYEAGFGDWMPDLNLDNPLVRAEIVNISNFWLDLGVDGFRLDAVTYYYTNQAQKSIDFLTWFKGIVRANKEDAYIVGEAWTGQDTINLYYRGIDSLFNFPSASSGGYIIDNITSETGSSFAFRLADTHQKVLAINEDGLVANFLTNHDMDRSSAMFIANVANRQKLAASVYLLTPGIPFIYYGEEIGLKGTRGGAQTDANRRLPMQWQKNIDPWRTDFPTGTNYNMANQIREGAFDLLEEPFSLTNHYKKVLSIRNDYPWLVDARVTQVVLPSSALAALKLTSKDGNESIYVVHNFAATAETFKLSRLDDQKLVIAHDIYTNLERSSINKEILTLGASSSVVIEKR